MSHCLSPRGRRYLCLPYLFIFAILLFCNLRTSYLADDYAYMFSFQTGERIRSILDIFPSMLGHAQTMNGRLTAHFLVQLTFLLPSKGFDLLNAGVFTLLIFLICRTARAEGPRHALVCLASFAAIWLFEPAFGQVNLWQDGSVNYLWGQVLGLLFLQPFVTNFLCDKTQKKPWYLFPLALAAGAYSETVSASILFMAGCLVLLDWSLNGHKWNLFLTALAAVGFLGYVSIYLAPAQWMNKSVEAGGFGEALNRVIQVYGRFTWLLCGFAVALIFQLSAGGDRKRVALACVLALGSVVCNSMMLFANQYPPRSACGACLFLLCGCMVLLEPLLDIKKQPLMVSAAVSLVIVGLFRLPVGMQAVNDLYRRHQYNMQLMTWQTEDGVKDVVLRNITGDSEYSPVYGLTYLNTEDADSWPNDSMAEYFCVDSISCEK